VRSNATPHDGTSESVELPAQETTPGGPHGPAVEVRHRDLARLAVDGLDTRPAPSEPRGRPSPAAEQLASGRARELTADMIV